MSTDYRNGTQAAAELSRLVVKVGTGSTASAFPAGLLLTPVSRWPTRLAESTIRTVLDRPVPGPLCRDPGTTCANKGISIIIVTHNGLVFNRLCLESLLINTEYPDYEVIVVDNASSDGTRDYLNALTQAHPNVRAVFNESNRGFASANNQGIALAKGNLFILLNNDTIVPRNWLTRLVRHLEDPSIGLAGPVTNRTGNEAQIETNYGTYAEFEAFASTVLAQQVSKSFEIRMLAMFCLAMRRSVYERIGPLDEQFEVGLFEDDDYSMRAWSQGLKVVSAEDVFVHHFGQASLGNLAEGGYGKLFHANRRRWEQKWGASWEPYKRRPIPHYQQLTERIRATVKATLPTGATVLVVSNGDEELLRHSDITAWHFPQDQDGGYAGYHPVDSAEAISRLEALRAQGAEFLLFPSTALWWLDYYGGLKQNLERHYSVVADCEASCRIFALADRES